MEKMDQARFQLKCAEKEPINCGISLTTERLSGLNIVLETEPRESA